MKKLIGSILVALTLVLSVIGLTACDLVNFNWGTGNDHEHHFTEYEAHDPTCATPGNKRYFKCDVGSDACGKIYEDLAAMTPVPESEVIIPALGHKYDLENIVWSAWNGKQITATVTCTQCDENEPGHVLHPEITLKGEKSKDPTCTAKGETTYTASFTYEGKTYTCPTTTTVADIESTPHVYGQPEWKWTPDHKATATFKCQNETDPTPVVMEAKVTDAVTKAPTCTAKGETTYTATVEFNGETYTSTTTADIEMTPHTYQAPTWSWNDDHSQATATLKCKDCTEQQTVTVTATESANGKIEKSEAEIPGECQNGTKTTYTATVNFNGKEYKADPVEVVTKEPVKQHTAGAWQHDATQHWHKCSVCGKDMDDKTDHSFKDGHTCECGFVEESITVTAISLSAAEGKVVLTVNGTCTGYADLAALKAAFGTFGFSGATSGWKYPAYDDAEKFNVTLTDKAWTITVEVSFLTSDAYSVCLNNGGGGDIKPTFDVTGSAELEDKTYSLSVNGNNNLTLTIADKVVVNKTHEITGAEIAKDGDKVYVTVTGTYAGYENAAEFLADLKDGKDTDKLGFRIFENSGSYSTVLGYDSNLITYTANDNDDNQFTVRFDVTDLPARGYQIGHDYSDYGDIKTVNYTGEAETDKNTYELVGNANNLTLTIKEAIPPQPSEATYAVTALTIEKQGDAVYVVYRGTFEAYETSALEKVLKQQLRLKICKVGGGNTGAEGNGWSFSTDQGTWEMKLNITVGSNDLFTAGTYYIDGLNNYTDPKEHFNLWQTDVVVDLGEYKYKASAPIGQKDDTVYTWGNVAFVIENQKGSFELASVTLEAGDAAYVVYNGTHNYGNLEQLKADLQEVYLAFGQTKVSDRVVSAQEGTWTIKVNVTALNLGDQPYYFLYFNGTSPEGDVKLPKEDSPDVTITVGQKKYSIENHFGGGADDYWGYVILKISPAITYDFTGITLEKTDTAVYFVASGSHTYTDTEQLKTILDGIKFAFGGTEDNTGLEKQIEVAKDSWSIKFNVTSLAAQENPYYFHFFYGADSEGDIRLKNEHAKDGEFVEFAGNKYSIVNKGDGVNTNDDATYWGCVCLKIEAAPAPDEERTISLNKTEFYGVTYVSIGMSEDDFKFLQTYATKLVVVGQDKTYPLPNKENNVIVNGFGYNVNVGVEKAAFTLEWYSGEKKIATATYTPGVDPQPEQKLDFFDVSLPGDGCLIIRVKPTGFSEEDLAQEKVSITVNGNKIFASTLETAGDNIHLYHFDIKSVAAGTHVIHFDLGAGSNCPATTIDQGSKQQTIDHKTYSIAIEGNELKLTVIDGELLPQNDEAGAPLGWSYYGGDGRVAPNGATIKDGVVTIVLTESTAGAWRTAQVYYKDAELKQGDKYTVSMTITSTVAGKIWFFENEAWASEIALTENVAYKFTSQEVTHGAQTTVKLFMGEKNNDNGKLIGATVTIADLKINVVSETPRDNDPDGTEYNAKYENLETDPAKGSESVVPQDTWGFWYGEGLTAKDVKASGDNGFTFTYSGEGAWYGMQVFYKNSKMYNGTEYTLTFKINVSKACKITINDQPKELHEGDNDVSIVFTLNGNEFGKNDGRSAFDLQMGVNGETVNTDGDIIVTISNVVWTKGNHLPGGTDPQPSEKKIESAEVYLDGEDLLVFETSPTEYTADEAKTAIWITLMGSKNPTTVEKPNGALKFSINLHDFTEMQVGQSYDIHVTVEDKPITLSMRAGGATQKEFGDKIYTLEVSGGVLKITVTAKGGEEEPPVGSKVEITNVYNHAMDPSILTFYVQGTLTEEQANSAVILANGITELKPNEVIKGGDNFCFKVKLDTLDANEVGIKYTLTLKIGDETFALAKSDVSGTSTGDGKIYSLSFEDGNLQLTVKTEAESGTTAENPLSVSDLADIFADEQNFDEQGFYAKDGKAQEVYVTGIVTNYDAEAKQVTLQQIERRGGVTPVALSAEDVTIVLDASALGGRNFVVGDVLVVKGYLQKSESTLKITGNDGAAPEIATWESGSEAQVDAEAESKALSAFFTTLAEEVKGMSEMTGEYDLPSPTRPGVTFAFKVTAGDAAVKIEGDKLIVTRGVTAVEAKIEVTVKIGGEDHTPTGGPFSITVPQKEADDLVEDLVVSLSFKKAEYSALDKDDKASGYTVTWEATRGSRVWTLEGFNNNGNQWDLIKAGRKDVASTGTITSPLFAEKLTKVVVNIGDSFANVKKFALQISKTADFVQTDENTVTEIVMSGQAKSAITFQIETPQADSYYRIVVDSDPGSNGSAVINGIEYWGKITPDMQKVNQELSKLSIEEREFEEDKDVTLPTSSVDGVEFVWSVVDGGEAATIDKDGKTLHIVRQATEVEFILKVTVKCGEASGETGFAMIAHRKLQEGEKLPFYTLDTTDTQNKTKNNSYTGEGTVTIDGVTWTVQGNGTAQPWRFGGKSGNCSKTDRTLRSTTVTGKVTELKITFGAQSKMTVNSVTLKVHSETEEYTRTITYAQNSSFTVEAGDDDWTNCSYEFIFNLTATSSSDNGYMSVAKVEFFA